MSEIALHLFITRGCYKHGQDCRLASAGSLWPMR